MCGGKKSKMPAKQNEGGDVPAHDKNANGHAHNGGADRVHITEVFRCEKKGIGAKAFHEATVHHAEHQHPEKQKDLVFSKMKKKQL